MKAKIIDVTKPVQTVGGARAEIIDRISRKTRDGRVIPNDFFGNSTYPIVAQVMTPGGWVLSTFTEQGYFCCSYHPDPRLDIINVPEAPVEQKPATAAFDPRKPVQTRNGLPALILSTEGREAQGGRNKPIVAQILHSDGSSIYRSFFPDGSRWPGVVNDHLDLVNIPEPKAEPPTEKLSGFLNIYSSGYIYHYRSREGADDGAVKKRVACLDLSKFNITYKYGDGL